MLLVLLLFFTSWSILKLIDGPKTPAPLWRTIVVIVLLVIAWVSYGFSINIGAHAANLHVG